MIKSVKTPKTGNFVIEIGTHRIGVITQANPLGIKLSWTDEPDSPEAKGWKQPENFLWVERRSCWMFSKKGF